MAEEDYETVRRMGFTGHQTGYEPKQKKKPTTGEEIRKVATGAVDTIGNVFRTAGQPVQDSPGNDFGAPFQGADRARMNNAGPMSLPSLPPVDVDARQLGVATRKAGEGISEGMGNVGAYFGEKWNQAVTGAKAAYEGVADPMRRFNEGLNPPSNVVGVQPQPGGGAPPSPAEVADLFKAPSDPAPAPQLPATATTAPVTQDVPPEAVKSAKLPTTGATTKEAPATPAGQPGPTGMTPAEVEADPGVQKMKQAAPDAQITPSGQVATVTAGDKSVDISPVRVIRGMDQSMELSWADQDRLSAAGPEVLRGAVEHMAKLNAAIRGEVYQPVSAEQIEAKAKMIEAEAAALKAVTESSKRFKAGPNRTEYGPGGVPTAQVPNVFDQFTGLPAGVAQATGQNKGEGSKPPAENDIDVSRDAKTGEIVTKVYIAGEWVEKSREKAEG